MGSRSRLAARGATHYSPPNCNGSHWINRSSKCVGALARVKRHSFMLGSHSQRQTSSMGINSRQLMKGIQISEQVHVRGYDNALLS